MSKLSAALYLNITARKISKTLRVGRTIKVKTPTSYHLRVAQSLVVVVSDLCRDTVRLALLMHSSCRVDQLPLLLWLKLEEW
jgi:hypothetical protein